LSIGVAVTDEDAQESRPISQEWFWDERWQEGEREAEDDIVHNRHENFDSFEDFETSLKLSE
jgi:hypothetical protein